MGLKSRYLLNARDEFQIEGRGELRLDPLFSDGVVLQRDQAISISGTAKPGVGVSVKLGVLSEETISDHRGRWQVGFGPMGAAGPLNISAESGGQILEISDVYIGEVWLCAGQSNVMWSLNDIGLTGDGADGNRLETSNLRILRVPERPFAQAFNALPSLKWKVENVVDKGSLPALPTFLVEQLDRSLDCKVGVIVSALAGSSIVSWIPRNGFCEDSELNYLLRDYPADPDDYEEQIEQWQIERKKFDDLNRDRVENGLSMLPYTKYLFWGPKGSRCLAYPSGAFEAMIRPLVSFSVRGVVWYQGESDAYFPEKYGRRLRLMIKKWREYWKLNANQNELPFVNIQLPAFEGDPESANWPFVREQQQEVAELMEQVHCVPATDLGDPKDIHPSDKKAMAKRISVFASALSRAEIPPEPPIISSWQFDETDGGTFGRVKILTSSALGEPKEKYFPGIQLIDSNGDAMPVMATLDSPRCIVAESPIRADRIKGFCYNWSSSPTGPLKGLNGLPLMPYRSKNWGCLLPPYRSSSEC